MTVRFALVAVLPVLALLVPFLPAPAHAADSEESRSVVRRMIEAHGGMERWTSAPTVAFTDEWRSGESESGLPARIVVEQGSRRATIDFPGTPMRMAWDGERAWSVDWGLPMPPRFLALLNYYFLNLPWVAMDPGTVLGEPGTGTLPGDDTEYVTVMLTYEDGVGDTPDDWYRLYIHPDTHRLAACDYIVTYEALLPEGAEHTPVHLLVYDEWTTVDGLTVPTHFTIYEEDRVYASCAISDWSFTEAFDPSRLDMPDDAVVDTTAP